MAIIFCFLNRYSSTDLKLQLHRKHLKHMPAVKFFACLDFEQKSSFCKRLKLFHIYYLAAGFMKNSLRQSVLNQTHKAVIVSIIKEGSLLIKY